MGLLRNYAKHWDDAAPQVAPGEVLTYGPAPQQTLELWPAKGAAKAPLVLFVHGGAWSRGDRANATGRWKEAHFPGTGVAFATIDYRLVPQATVEDEAADVAHALAKVIAEADRLGVDRHRIVLMGHSAGAHLVALVGTDEHYLREAGLGFADVAGVVAIDGAAYDVPAQLRDGPQIMQKLYGEAFGTDPARQAKMSPTLQAGAPNAARFLLLHVQRADGVRQSEALAKALEAGGSKVDVVSLPGQGLIGHIEINRRLGEPGYAATQAVDGWLKALFS
ncbi:MAG: alpha/beta hydrolase [Sphingomonadales bacterium]|nr:alpha/beta hydrolase [Sphingomonadales bacterium]